MKQKNFIPYIGYRLRTSLSREDVCKRLLDSASDAPAAAKLFEMPLVAKQSYFTSFYDNDFVIRIVSSGRDSLVPLVSGSINEDANGICMDVEMHLKPFAKWFMIVWFGLVGLLSLGGVCLIVYLIIHARFGITHLFFMIPLLFLLIGFFIMWGSFTEECDKCRIFLHKLLDAKEEV